MDELLDILQVIAPPDEFDVPAEHVVGIGASAGGLEALQSFLSNLPGDLENTAIIVAQHLSPTYKSMMVQLLRRQTGWNVLEAEHGQAPKAGTIYITPPDADISLRAHRIMLDRPSAPHGPKPSIDVFFESLAREYGNQAIAVVLSGTGSDGTLGLKAVKENGGFTICQDPKNSKYDGMPNSAIQSGAVDIIANADHIGELISHRIHGRHDESSTPATTVVQEILHHVSTVTGVDFSNYKTTTVLRRLAKRIQELEIPSKEQYLEYLHENTGEAERLIDAMLIGVTSFFRDIEAFKALERYVEVVVSAKEPGERIRVWAAGCATGEEAYSIAIMLSNVLGGRIHDYEVQVFATDISEKAISLARKGIFSKEQVELVPKDIIDRYFKVKDDSYELDKAIRSMVLFSRHDVIANPPFLKLDLISCRNLLIYFNSHLQQQIFPVFHYALQPGGYLFLGKSESIGNFGNLFAAVDNKNKIFRCKRVALRTSNRANVQGAVKSNRLGKVEESGDKSRISLMGMVRETLFNTFDYAYVVVNTNFDIQDVRGDVRLFLTIPDGAPNQNVVKLAVKELQYDLRTSLARARKENRSVRSRLRNYKMFRADVIVRIVVKPVTNLQHRSPDFFVVVFETFDRRDNLSAHLPGHGKPEENKQLEDLEYELNATKEQLQNYIEELESANEELQSVNEELQASNEELQSSNEELETSNEELQSTNEELQIAYGELRTLTEVAVAKETELRKAKDNLQALLNNTMQEFALFDTDLRVVAFNHTAAQRARMLVGKDITVGSTVFDMLLSSEYKDFRQNFQASMKGTMVELEREVVDNDQNQRWFRYNYTPITNDQGRVVLVSLAILDVTELNKARHELDRREQVIDSLFGRSELAIAHIDQSMRFIRVSEGFRHLVGFGPGELTGQSYLIVLDPTERSAAGDLMSLVRSTGAGDRVLAFVRRDGTRFNASISLSRLNEALGDSTYFAVVALLATTGTSLN